MKRWALLIVIILAAVGAMVYSHHRKVNAPASANAIVNFTAETERELSRVPMKLTRLSDAEEIRIGRDLAARYSASFRSQWTPATDAPIEQYLNLVGGRVIGGNPAGGNMGLRTRRKLAYRFHYIPDKTLINAFALPGGEIFVGRGLLEIMGSEDQLAAVLGHEVEHVDLYHSAERVQIEARLRHIPLSGLVSLPIIIFQAGYSKEQEMEADREGARLAVGAAYSPLGAVRMFETFERLRKEYVLQAKTPQQELSQVAIQTLTGYFRSHPLPAERKRQVETMMIREHWPAKAEQPLSAVAPR